ncbi:pseudomurein-binding repeat-containing protein [Methanobrevibacter arboriphilus]
MSLANIKDAASRVNAFVNQNNELPNYVEINSKKIYNV